MKDDNAPVFRMTAARFNALFGQTFDETPSTLQSVTMAALHEDAFGGQGWSCLLQQGGTALARGRQEGRGGCMVWTPCAPHDVNGPRLREARRAAAEALGMADHPLREEALDYIVSAIEPGQPLVEGVEGARGIIGG